MTVWAFACGVKYEWLRKGHKNAPSPDGDGADVRHEGFEPPTFWLGVDESLTSGNNSGVVSPLRRGIGPVAA